MTIIYRIIIHISRQRKWRNGCKTISNTASPHYHLPVTSKHERIRPGHLFKVIYKAFRIFRIVFFSEIFTPKKTIHLISPHTIIIVRRIVYIPSFTPIIGQRQIQKLLHKRFIYLVSHTFKEAKYKQIKETPIRRYSRTIRIAQHGMSQCIFLLLRQGIP